MGKNSSARKALNPHGKATEIPERPLHIQTDLLNSQNPFALLTVERCQKHSVSSEEDSGESSCEDRSSPESTQHESMDESSTSESVPEKSEASSASEIPFTTVTRKKRKKSEVSLPGGVEVICEHYQANSSNTKVCGGCESKCFLAYFSQVSNKWEKIRPCPGHLQLYNTIELNPCIRYQHKKPCTSNCGHPHGPEITVWQMERQGGLPSRKRFLRNTSRKEASSNITKKRSRKKKQKVKTNTTEVTLPAQQPSTSIASTTSRANCVNASHPAPNHTEPRGSTSQQTPNHNEPRVSTSQPTLNHTKPRGSTSQPTPNHTKPRASTSQQTPNHTKPLQQNQGQVQNVCYLPKGVTLICDHNYKNAVPPLGIGKRMRRCRQCEAERSTDVKYAFWSNKFSRWFLIRSRPTNVRPCTAFQDCRHFIRGYCEKDDCTFGHGPETMMWSMEREGVLALPKDAINCVIEDESLNRGSMIRPLPSTEKSGNFQLCESIKSGIICRFGRVCPNAHSQDELMEWREAFREKVQNANQQNEPHAKENPQRKNQTIDGAHDSACSPRQQPYKVTEKLSGVELRCNPENPNVTITETGDQHQYRWTFRIRFKVENGMKLPMVFLGERHCGYFRLKSISINAIENEKKSQLANKPYFKDLVIDNAKLLHYKPDDSVLNSLGTNIEMEVAVEFRSSVFASFTQRVLFDFGVEPLLKKEFNIDVLSKGMDDMIRQLSSVRKELSQTTVNFNESRIVRMETNEEKSQLFERYSLPKDVERIVSAQMVDKDGIVTPDHYVQVMHQLLYAEEAHMKSLLARLSPSNAKIEISKFFFDESKGLLTTSDGEFFGSIDLHSIVTPDDTAGRVCTRKVQSVLLQPRGVHTFLYEAPIEVLKEKKVVVKLFPKLCQDLKIEKDGQQIDVQMWFNLNRVVMCRMHKALDILTETHKRLLFPIRQSIKRQEEIVPTWLKDLDKQLNENQLNVISAITKIQSPSAPLVIFGPFGTGKTFTLNRAILHLVSKQNNRVLLCTHTNSAADIHVGLLDEYLKKHKMTEAKPLRLCDPERKVSTVSQVTQKYCLIENDAFALPSRQDVNRHKVVITTLVTADLLTRLAVHHGFFTHILIDEAAQTWETEAIIPISLAGPNTKIVFTGDHQQMSPEVYTKFTSGYGLQKSLPERLFDHYNQIETDTEKTFQNNHLIFLNVNYRNNSEILKFASDNFYGGAIVAMADEESPAHPKFGPLMFFTSRGKDEKKHDNTYLNAAEVSEVVKRVQELVESWPECWGHKVLKDIAVLAPYRYQVQAIRGELRKAKLGKVTVDTIHNVQGLEFRALFISTVRTRESVKDLEQPHEDLSLEFLSDPKLLVTAITRAKSFVAVVGDPVSLCTLGSCRNLWMDYILRCAKLEKLHGITMKELKREIDAAIDPSNHLNPEAAPFVPRNTEAVIENERICILKDERIPNGEDEEEEEEESCTHSSTFSSDADDEFEEDLRIEDPPKHMDKIIKALVKSVKTAKKSEFSCMSLASPSSSNLRSFEDEVPYLPTDIERELKPNLRGLSSSDYEMIRINGRDVIRLISLYRNISNRARKTYTDYTDNTSRDHLSPEVLNRMLNDEPSRYVIAQLRVGVDRSRTSYIEFPDKTKPDIKIKGDVKKAFDRDTVVIDLEKLDMDSSSSCKCDCVVGILHHLIHPRERQYVCKLDDLQQNNNALMVPINKSVPKIVNFSEASRTEKIPLYKKITKEKESIYKVREIDATKSRRNKSLFLVQFLHWRSDFKHPLGIALRTFERGENIRDCLKIVDAEHGVRRADETQAHKEVKRAFPPNWQIPNYEKSRREEVNNAFTIDPEGSKDLDDAISVTPLEDGTYKVGVHIADVSYFVKHGSKVDQDARKRGTTYYSGIPKMKVGSPLPWYFENVPMLPRSLSENHCSLLEKKDRLTRTVYVQVDGCGRTLTFPTEVKSTVTCSRCQLTYSDAQRLIEGCIPNKEMEGEDLKLLQDSVPLLHSIAQNLRSRRLGTIGHRDEKHDVAAHELVEEMMILANQAVGRILSTNREQQRITPFVSHPEPKVHRLNKWANDYGKYARYHPTMLKYLESKDIEADVQTRIFTVDSDQTNVMIFQSCWNELLSNVMNGNYAMLPFIIGRLDSSPQFQLTNLSLRRIQRRSEYKCPSDDEDVFHYGLGLSNYVHFTSPIRRYVDIEIHRRLNSDRVQYEIEDVETFCRRSTFIKDNAKKFEKACKRTFFAQQLKDCTEGLEVIVDEVDTHSFVIHAVDEEHDLFSNNNNRISYQDLSVFDEPSQSGEDLETTLTWRVRIYTGPSVQENSQDGKISRPQYREKTLMKNLLLSVAPDDTSIQQVYQVQGRKWLALIKASQMENNSDEIDCLIKDIEKDLQVPQRDGINESTTVISPYAIQTVNVRPHDEEGHYYTITMTLKQFDIIYVQLFPRLSRSVLTPDIQLFKISSNFHICVEHRRLPRLCFANSHHVPASQNTPSAAYESIGAYISHWKPVLAIELASQAVSHNEGFVLKSHLIKWSYNQDDGRKIEGTFSLKASYCTARQLEFSFGDFACVRIQKEAEKSSMVDITSSQSDDEGTSFPNAKLGKSILVCHCVFTKVKPEKESQFLNVTLVVNNMTSEMPQTFLDGNSHVCDLEVIRVPVPLRRMNVALNSNLRSATELVKSICCGWKPIQHSFSNPDDNLSIANHYNESGFHPLNQFQNAAVRKALQKSFCLIQGPPGTGKTVTGVHIAYWFAKRNLEEMDQNDTTDGEDNETNDGEVTPPQVLYCGPSNKSVDVVTEYLLRIPGMKEKILRVYGSMIEETEYPIPNKVTHLKPSVSEDELKIPEGELKEVSLHHVIRNPPCPYWRDLKEMEASFKESKKNKVRPSDEDVNLYLKRISEAEEWAVKFGKQIILCTCSRSGSKLITEKCNIKQCIVDESGMCTEPEVLVPMTSSKASQIVLIGDHKQLQPIVTDREARRMGLSRSMFDRLHKEAEMLKIQYRMHKEICAFPSTQFYDGKLLTDQTVIGRKNSEVDFWPAVRHGPIAFCNVQGEERSSVVATAESGAESKFNEEEANKAVEVAKHLVNKYGVEKSDVVILTPYREHRKLIADKLKGAYDDIRVTTIIKSQGSEWDYVIISLVRSLPDDDIDREPSLSWLSEHLGFIQDDHQINVALTRAKYGLCIIGNKNLISLNPTWNSLIEHYDKNDCIVERWQWP